MGVLLFSGAALQPRLQRVENLKLSVVKDLGCRAVMIASRAGEHDTG